MHTVWISGSQSREKSHLSYKEDTRALQLEVDQLKRKLRHAQRRLMMERMPIIDKGQRPHLASLSPTSRSNTTNVGIRAHLAKAWEMTPRARRWTKFPDHPSYVGLKGRDFLGDSTS